MLRLLLTVLILTVLAAPATLLTAQPVAIYSRPQQPERSRTYDVLHYRIGLRFDDTTNSFWGETAITLTPLHDGFVRCELDAETFVVDAVTDTQGRALDFEQPEHGLVVRFPEAYAYTDTLTFTVTYHAEQVDVDEVAFGMGAGYDLGLGV